MIDQVLALSLSRSKQRRDLYIGGMAKAGVPYEQIAFARGEDGRDYTSFDAIAAAAERDGFPFVGYFQGHGDTGIIQQTPAQMAQVWSYAQILRYIANGDKNVLVTWDDRILSVPFGFLETVVGQLHAEREVPFYLFQLRIRGTPEYVRLPERNYYEDEQIHLWLFQSLTNLSVSINYADVFTLPGLLGYDETIVFSPTGARWMLEEMYNIQDIDPEIKRLHYDDIPHVQKPIYNPTLNIDNWICWGLRPAADIAIGQEKGLYRPRYPGFHFIEDPIALGSLTEWASKDVEKFAFSSYNEDYNFVDLTPL